MHIIFLLSRQYFGLNRKLTEASLDAWSFSVSFSISCFCLFSIANITSLYSSSTTLRSSWILNRIRFSKLSSNFSLFPEFILNRENLINPGRKQYVNQQWGELIRFLCSCAASRSLSFSASIFKRFEKSKEINLKLL